MYTNITQNRKELAKKILKNFTEKEKEQLLISFLVYSYQNDGIFQLNSRLAHVQEEKEKEEKRKARKETGLVGEVPR